MDARDIEETWRNSTFGQRLKILREDRRLTQKEAAKRLGLTQQSFSLYEKLETPPKMATIRRLCDAIEAPPGSAVLLQTDSLTPPWLTGENEKDEQEAAFENYIDWLGYKVFSSTQEIEIFDLFANNRFSIAIDEYQKFKKDVADFVRFRISQIENREIMNNPKTKEAV